MANELDWQALVKTADDPNRLVYEDVKSRFRKVAWDVYKPLTGSDMLWELRDVEGEKFLFALYDGDEAELTVKSKTETSPWTAISSLAGENVTLSWEGVPVYRFANSEYKFKTSEANDFAKFIQRKASDESFVEGIKAKMPEIKRKALEKLMNQREA